MRRIVQIGCIALALAAQGARAAEEPQSLHNDIFGPYIGFFCRTETQLRDAIRVYSYGKSSTETIRVVRKIHGKYSCEFGWVEQLKLLAVRKPERVFPSGRLIIFEVETLNNQKRAFSFVTSLANEEDV